ncbi:hypothetical protein G7054_g3830 [Neopestalotiopsis clavispora]|nr:hypothetical protein G7054_g3830 [Neopestalotiopsis clavispora]
MLIPNSNRQKECIAWTVKSDPLYSDAPNSSLEYLDLKKKLFIVLCGIVCMWNSNLGSSITSGCVDEIAKHFSIQNNTQLVLLNSIYLLGYTFGPTVFGPLSEYSGRRPVLIATFISYILFTAASALSPNYTSLLIFRLLSGVAGSAPNAVVGAMYADIYQDPAHRGTAMALFIAAGCAAPSCGPIVSGFAGTVSWNLSFWIAAGLGTVGLPCVVCLPEMYGPVLQSRSLKGRSLKVQEASPISDDVQGPRSPISSGSSTSLLLVFKRALFMVSSEPLVFFASIYLALVYSILYLFLQAYPIIFKVFVGCLLGLVVHFKF